MSSNKPSTALLSGFGLVAAAAVVLAALLGTRSVAAGIAAGIGIAYLGFLLYFFLFPRPGEGGVPLLRGYLPGAVLRYAIMIGTFCAVVFVCRVNAIGVLIGTFVGMMVSTFASLNKMRQVPPVKPPET